MSGAHRGCEQALDVLNPEEFYGEIALYGFQRETANRDEVGKDGGKRWIRKVVAHGVEVRLAVYESVCVSVVQVAREAPARDCADLVIFVQAALFVQRPLWDLCGSRCR